MSQAKAEAIAEIEKAIAAIEAIPNYNLEFYFGYALGVATTYWRCDLITYDELNDIHQQINAAHSTVLNRK